MRRVRRKGGNKEKVFGCDLLEHLNASSQEIPQVLRCCSEFVEKNGIVDGIYRLSGVSSNIQKLRGEFESDGSPDLNKDLYLQDIHCVSSLCKAYFRELPNPLLTYQLYDKFAEAVAIQLEEERLVKIRDVLKELPKPHYRTLEFLMRHLVRMASYCSETNMHSRNLAIVWAPNLLRSKDIEASGFNGTAAFMEVRVQSIVVEFILTHVPQLFPEQGVSNERRQSLPSPSAASSQEEGFFKAAPAHPFPNIGNISPGDGPLPIRPYHAIIEGTDKRKGSLKGRKWMSIFNIGGRFHDQRRRHKHSAKEKERPTLRPARSMDSLSIQPYPNEGSRRTAQRPPSTNISTTSPLAAPPPQAGSDVAVSTGAIGGSEYAVTYRRGTGLVSGGVGTQGTYTVLDPEGLGVTSNETLQSRSPGLSTKVGRRAAMHITGPTMVTVPLHITSNLALGVLQGGGGDRVIHRGRDKDGGDRLDGQEGGEKAQRKKSIVMERKVEEEEKSHQVKVTDREGVVDAGGNTVVGSSGEEEGEGKTEEEVRGEPEPVMRGRSVSREQRAKNLPSYTEGGDDESAVMDVDDNDGYMDMKDVNPADFQPAGTECVFDASDVLNSTEVEADDLGLSGYVQDNFEFLDQMDCSVLDHMDCSVPYQVNEFSVEPPGHSDDEYEVMVQAHPSHHPTEPQTQLQPGPETHTQSQTELNPHRPLSIDTHSRHTKSLSLPYMTSPVHGPDESCSEDDVAGDDSDDNDYSSEDDESMFVKSLPADFFLSNFELVSGSIDGCSLDGVPEHQLQSSEERQCLNLELSACKELTSIEPEQVEVTDKEDEDGHEEKEVTMKEEEIHQGGDQQENNTQSKASEEDHSDEDPPLSPEASTCCCAELPLQSNVTLEGEKEVVDDPRSDYPLCHAGSCFTQEENADVLLEVLLEPVKETEQPSAGCVTKESDEVEDRKVDKEIEDMCQEMVLEVKESDEVEDRKVDKEIEDMCQEMVLEVKESDEVEDRKVDKEIEDMCQEMVLEVKESDEVEDRKVDKEIEDMCQEMVLEVKESDEHIWKETAEAGNAAICRASREFWDELEDVVCEVIEDEESKQVEKKGAKESVAVEPDTIYNVKDGEEEEQVKKVSGEKEVDEGGAKETDAAIEVLKESMEATEEKLTEPKLQQEFDERDTNLSNASQLDEAIQEKHGFNDRAQHHDREDVASDKENNNKERAKQRRTQSSVDKQLNEARSDMRELKDSRKCEESDSSPGGVGRKLVVSKQPKVYQVKAVPVVPPKPQHCKITALSLRQQQQQQPRKARDADRGRENTLTAPTEQDKVCAGEPGKDGDDGHEDGGERGKPTLRGGDRERERRRDGDESAGRDTNSPISMCFDEAVAIATMRRGKEKECEKEKEKQRDWRNEVQ